MFAIKNSRLTIPILALLVAGCAIVPDLVRQTKFERTSRAYEKAIRWSDFEEAEHFLKDTAKKKNPPDLNIDWRADKYAQANDIDLSTITGTGKDGRILLKDVKAK